jgi:hypothetical protein
MFELGTGPLAREQYSLAREVRPFHGRALTERVIVRNRDNDPFAP